MRGMGGMTVLVAALVFVVAATVFGSTVVNAVRVEEPVGAEAPERVAAEPGGRALTTRVTPYPNVTADEILTAVNQDLFQPDRTPPLERYQLPSERAAPAPVQEQDRRGRGPEFRIVGAAIMGDMALALVQVDDTIPVALLLGESIEGYTLAAVDAESATLVGENGILTLPVVEPLRGRERSSDRNQGRAVQFNNQTMEALQGRVQQMLQGMGRGQMRGGRGGGGGGEIPWDGTVLRLGGEAIEWIPAGGRLPGGSGGVLK